MYTIKTYCYQTNETYKETYKTEKERFIGLLSLLEREDNELTYQELKNLIETGIHSDGQDTIELSEVIK